jgi:hypothetical protein
MTVRLSALRTGSLLPPRIFLVLISVRDWVDPRAIVQLEGLVKLKKSTSSGFDPVTFWLVATATACSTISKYHLEVTYTCIIIIRQPAALANDLICRCSLEVATNYVAISKPMETADVLESHGCLLSLRTEMGYINRVQLPANLWTELNFVVYSYILSLRTKMVHVILDAHNYWQWDCPHTTGTVASCPSTASPIHLWVQSIKHCQVRSPLHQLRVVMTTTTPSSTPTFQFETLPTYQPPDRLHERA